jgi:hypothetical protein
MSVATRKEQHPELYCRAKGCLWRTVTQRGPSPCQKHPPTDDTMVDLDGSVVRWGDLMLADRKAYFQGGYGL